MTPEIDTMFARLMPDSHRGWAISPPTGACPLWTATSDNYDAWTDDEGQWVDNGEIVRAETRALLVEEIDAAVEEFEA